MTIFYNDIGKRILFQAHFWLPRAYPLAANLGGALPAEAVVLAEYDSA
jgi:hypothetical protein